MQNFINLGQPLLGEKKSKWKSRARSYGGRTWLYGGREQLYDGRARLFGGRARLYNAMILIGIDHIIHIIQRKA